MSKKIIDLITVIILVALLCACHLQVSNNTNNDVSSNNGTEEKTDNNETDITAPEQINNTKPDIDNDIKTEQKNEKDQTETEIETESESSFNSQEEISEIENSNNSGEIQDNGENNVSEGENIKNHFNELIAKINEYTAQFQGVYGVYYKNLVTGDGFGINEYELFYPASTIKLPMNLYIYKKINEGELDPGIKVSYIKDDFEWGTGIIKTKYNMEEGAEYPEVEYSVRKLCEFSIIYSDNIAVNMLYRVIDKENMMNYLKGLGGFSFNSDSMTCPYDMGIYLEELYKFYNEYPEPGSELIGYLSNTIYNNRIPAYLPAELTIAHKIGNIPRLSILHDVGIVFADEPYAVCIMSREIDWGEDGSQGCEVIAQISKMIYDFITN